MSLGKTVEWREVHQYTKEQLRVLNQIHRDQFGTDIKFVTRDDFKQWDLFLRGCLGTFVSLSALVVLGLLALYASVLAGYLERVPTLEELVVDRVVKEVQLLYPQDQNAFFNVEAGCFSGTLSSCQLELIDPFRVVEG